MTEHNLQDDNFLTLDYVLLFGILPRALVLIAEGSGQAFEPVLAEVFLDIREKVEFEHHRIQKA